MRNPFRREQPISIKDEMAKISKLEEQEMEAKFPGDENRLGYKQAQEIRQGLIKQLSADIVEVPDNSQIAQAENRKTKFLFKLPESQLLQFKEEALNTLRSLSSGELRGTELSKAVVREDVLGNGFNLGNSKVEAEEKVLLNQSLLADALSHVVARAEGNTPQDESTNNSTSDIVQLLSLSRKIIKEKYSGSLRQELEKIYNSVYSRVENTRLFEKAAQRNEKGTPRLDFSKFS